MMSTLLTNLYNSFSITSFLEKNTYAMEEASLPLPVSPTSRWMLLHGVDV